MRKWIKGAPILLAALLLVGVFCLTGCGNNDVHAEELDSELEATLQVDAVIDMSTIPEGIYIGDVDVGGMTSAQARAAIRDYVDAMAQQTVTLAANDEVIKTTVTELGFREDVDSTIEEALNYGQTGNVLERYKRLKDLETEDKVLPLVLTADEEQVRSYLEDHLWELNTAGSNYGLTRENGEFVIIEGEAGQTVDVDESVNLIMTYFSSGWQENSTIGLAVDVIEPKGSMEELSLVQDILGKYSTDYSSSSSARKTNIMVGASCIDGWLIYPGETFSVEAAVTPFNEEHGYELAGSYENGTTVDTYGGGICQVSTTLYNAAIRAELEIDERYGHSMLVSYIDPSADAAIAEGTKDLKFTNNTDAPIYISGYTDGSTISFTIYGHETRPSNRSVSFVSETTETVEPTTEYRASSSPFGYIEQVQTAHAGTKAELWKIVTVDGVEESREIFNTTSYTMYPAIYEVGTSTSNSSAEAAMYDAIASQSLDRIYDTISAYSYSSSSSSDSGGGDDDGSSSGESYDTGEETYVSEEEIYDSGGETVEETQYYEESSDNGGGGDYDDGGGGDAEVYVETESYESDEPAADG